MPPRPRPRLVAWASTADLLAVKDQFYPDQSATDQRQQAVNQVKAWLTRDRIPHAIESTMQLTEAVLQDRPGSSTTKLMLQLSYSTAICRFVNGLLDPAQKSHFAVPMHTLAINLGLPPSFVEIRHAATHESLPSLIVLRVSCNRALDWLWENFWLAVEESVNNGGGYSASLFAAERDNGQELRARMLVIQWVKVRKTVSGKQQNSKLGELSKEAVAIVKDCVSLCQEEDGVAMLIDAILEYDGEQQALEMQRQFESPKSATLLWMPLVEKLSLQVPNLAEPLATSVLDRLESPAAEEYHILCMDSNLRETEYKNAVYTWLENILGFGAKKRNLSPSASEVCDDDDEKRTQIIKHCISSPNKWSIRLAKNIIKSSPLSRKYSNSVAAAEKLLVSQSSISHSPAQASFKRPIGDVSDELEEYEARIEAMKAKREQWEKSHVKTSISSTKNSTTKQTQQLDSEGDCIMSLSKCSEDALDNNTSDLGGTVIAGKFRKANPWKYRPIGTVI